MPQFFYSAQFKQTAVWIAGNHPTPMGGLSTAMHYLLKYGRSAVSPDVEWHLKTSTYGANSGEVRWPDPELQTDYPRDAWRGLFVAATDTSWILFTVLGNKATGPDQGNDWYRKAIPLSDQIAAEDMQTEAFEHQPTRNH